MSGKSAEQQARDLLDRMEVDGAQNYSSGELVELANLINEHHEDVRIIQALRRQRDKAEAGIAGVRALHVLKVGWLSGEAYCGGCGRGTAHPCSTLAVLDAGEA